MKVVLLAGQDFLMNDILDRLVCDLKNVVDVDVVGVIFENDYGAIAKELVKTDFGAFLNKVRKHVSKTPPVDGAPKRILKESAVNMKIPYMCVAKIQSQKTLEFIHSFGADLLVTEGAGGIYRGWFIDQVPPMIHVHHGYLPDVRGMSSAQWTRWLGLPSVVSVHYIDTGIDTGAVVWREKFSWPDKHSYSKDFENIIRVTCSKALVNALCRIAQGDGLISKEISPQSSKQYFKMHKFLEDLVVSSNENSRSFL